MLSLGPHTQNVDEVEVIPIARNPGLEVCHDSGAGLLTVCAEAVRIPKSRISGIVPEPMTGDSIARLCLLDDASLAVGDEVGEIGYVFAGVAGGDSFADGSESVGGVELRGEQGAVGGAEFFELLRGEAATLEAYLVEAVGVVVALDGGE